MRYADCSEDIFSSLEYGSSSAAAATGSIVSMVITSLLLFTKNPFIVADAYSASIPQSAGTYCYQKLRN